MKVKTTQKLNDEIKRLNRLIKKNKADKRNEVRQKKVKVLKELKKLNNKLKSKQLTSRQHSIQYKDLSKKLKSYKSKRIKITKDDLKGFKGFSGISRDERYASIFSWKNSLGRGIIGAFARGGKLDDILGFETADYIDTAGNYQSIMEKLKTSYKEEFYDLLDKYFIIGNYTFDEILAIMGQARYAQRLYELFYYDPDDPRFDFDYFETKLIDFLDQIREDYNIL